MSADADSPSLSPDAARALSSVLDEIIPPSADGRLPGAGELGLAGRIERIAELRVVIEQGLAALDELAGSRDPRGFAALSPPDKREVLN